MTGSHHTLTASQTLASLAREHGLPDAAAIHDAPENAAIRRDRPTPESVRPGDRVFIPAPRQPVVDDIPVHGHDAGNATPAELAEAATDADVPPSQPLGDAKAAIVRRVARNLLNTVDIRPGGHSWFSA